jgi:serine/threonine protein phosphatase PrpC
MSAGVTTTTCPHCAAPVDPADRFCEECGQKIGDAAEPAAPSAAAGVVLPAPGEEIGGLGGASAVLEAALAEHREEAAAAASGPPRRPGVVVADADVETLPLSCAACAGRIAEDGYCAECGAPAVKPRDHWSEQPAPWVAMVCDRGQRHAINQDGAAIGAAADPGSFAALVICDGVSSAARSELASLAGARAARDVLVAPRPDPVPTAPAGVTRPTLMVPTPAAPTAPKAPAADPPAADPPAADAAAAPSDPAPADPASAGTDAPAPEPGSTSVTSTSSVLAAAMRQAGAAAQDQAVAAASDPPEHNPPACTFVAAALQGSTVVVGWVGDSRAYWLPQEGTPAQLSTDDSWAAEAMAYGFSRQDAERAPQAHSITRWLGRDAPDPVPRTVARRLQSPGWLLLCSDGLWNYCSEAADMRDLVLHTAAEVQQDCLATAQALVAWANQQGGHDNISVALARIG